MEGKNGVKTIVDSRAQHYGNTLTCLLIALLSCMCMHKSKWCTICYINFINNLLLPKSVRTITGNTVLPPGWSIAGKTEFQEISYVIFIMVLTSNIAILMWMVSIFLYKDALPVVTQGH